MNYKHIIGLNRNGLSINLRINNFPNKCPICNNHIHLNGASSSLYKENEVGKIPEIDLPFQCPSCKNAFIGKYKYVSHGELNENNLNFDLVEVFPKICNDIKFEKEIANLSSSFVEIYSQSICAEINNLNEIVGIGLRKALEFLIKDYICYKQPDQKEKVKELFLGKCISEYIDNPRLKMIAERAVWLGNDETHYVRKWEKKDIEDLKKLINITVSWIHAELLADKYESEMPKKS